MTAPRILPLADMLPQPVHADLIQTAVVLTDAEHRRLTPAEVSLLRRRLASPATAVTDAAAAGEELSCVLAELEAARDEQAAVARYRESLGGPSPLTWKAGATAEAARLLAARWDAHWPVSR